MITTQTLLMPYDDEARAQFKSLLREVLKEELSTFTPPPPKEELPEYLTRAETAKLYRISLVTLTYWEKNGLMPKKITVNGRVRFRRNEILSTLETAKQFKHKKRAA